MDARSMVERLVGATNAHDLDAVAACFAEDYENETPVHPGRGFRGRDQVRANWEQIFAFVPDVMAKVIRSAVDGDTVWTEWDMTGTRRDGSPHHMRGVIIFGVAGETATWARFYLEPVDERPGDVDQAVRDQVVRS
jgi:ketosteroid isomerase-like protein